VGQGSDQDGRVIQPDGWIHKVNLQSRTCSCRQYEENNVPCGHTMACICTQNGTDCGEDATVESLVRLAGGVESADLDVSILTDDIILLS